MIEYDRDKHEMLVVNWYVQELAGKPDEFANLFAKPLRNLTEILFWSARTVKLYFEIDVAGIWCASWIEPCMSGAYWGVWVREDKRKSKAMLAHVNQSLDLALRHFPVLMAPTKQPRLQSEMERLGWIREGQIPHLFDGDAAGVYWLDKESRDARFRRRKNIKQQQQPVQSVRADVGVDRPERVEHGEARPIDLLESGERGIEDRGSEREHPQHQRSRGRVKAKLKPKRKPVATKARTIGTGGNAIRRIDTRAGTGNQ